MKCPYCGEVDSKVIDSRPTEDGEKIRRRRECLNCKKRFTTYEIVETVPLMVVKKDRSREVFDRQKLLNGMLRACEKRPVSYTQLDAAVDRIEQQLLNSYDREVSSIHIGDLAMQELKQMDDVAYVRFASVYRQFSDVNTFMEELKDMLDSLLATLNEQYPDNAFVQNEVSNVDATIGKEFMLKSIVALVAACVLILLYVAYRFRRIGGLKAGSTAIVALLHDMLVVFGVFVILRIPLNGNFIAALLTILGYSINDTVVIYDRIRENSALYNKKQLSLAELVNLSLNQSFARSLMTSITTCLALGVVCIISVIYRLDSIYSFAFPLLFGMVSGVYSTICIATPLWVDWKTKKKAAKQA